MSAEQPTEEELQAAWEEQMRSITPADLILQSTVSLINLAGRRLGVAPGTEQERDLGQVRDAIDGAQALLPVLERAEEASELAPLRDALSQLKMEYAKLAGGAAEQPAAPAGEQPQEPKAGPAQSSGRLWVPDS
jgi:hypothetical protein